MYIKNITNKSNSKMLENRCQKYEDPMLFKRDEEFLLFHDFTQLERIKANLEQKKNGYWAMKWNAFKLMDLDVYRYFRILPRGKLSGNIFK